MKQVSYIIYSFLEAARGNWRNAIYLECRTCPYSKTQDCNGNLITADAEGKLIILPVSLFREWTGQQVEKTECAGIITRRAFEAAFPLYLEWHTVSDEACSLLQRLTMTYGEGVTTGEILTKQDETR